MALAPACGRRRSCLLALAFARPFLRQAGPAGPRRRRAAADRRADRHQRQHAPRRPLAAGQGAGRGRCIAELPAGRSSWPSSPSTDRAGRCSASRESATLDPARRQAVALARLDAARADLGGDGPGPGARSTPWPRSRTWPTPSEKAGRMPRRIVLISDLQQGSRLDALGDFEWPSDVELELKTVADDGSNAGLQRLAEPVEAEPPRPTTAQRRVRVSTTPSPSRERFELLWTDDDGTGAGKPIDVYVPPGESRVVRVPRPPGRRRSAIAPAQGRHARRSTTRSTSPTSAGRRRPSSTSAPIAADDPDRACSITSSASSSTRPRRTRHVSIATPPTALDWRSIRNDPPPLVVLAAETTPQNVRRLREYVRGGGTVLYVVTAPGPGRDARRPWRVSPPVTSRKRPSRRDVMLGEIAFDHPLFAPFAGAAVQRLHQDPLLEASASSTRAALGDARVLARFENGDPAVIEKTVGQGAARRPGQRLEPGRQPARAVVQVRAADVGACSNATNPRPFDADEPPRARPGAAAGRGRRSPRGWSSHKPDGATVDDRAGSAIFDRDRSAGRLRGRRRPAGPRRSP